MATQKSIKKRPGGFNRGLADWLRSSASLMGEHSNFDGIAKAIAKGGNQGCSGTKGVGRELSEPFEHWGDLLKLHAAFSAAERYATAFREATTWDRWVLCARYLCRNETLPLGLASAAGDLGAVVALVAYRLGVWDTFLHSCGKDEFARWVGIAEIVSEDAHGRIDDALAAYDAAHGEDGAA
jgi:hypothetical protein